MKYGEIRHVTDSHFIWRIPDFASVVKRNKYALYSPTIEFAGEPWSILICKQENRLVTCFKLFWNSLVDYKYTVTYKFSIRDSEGKLYWTSAVLLHEFKDDLEPNTGHGLFASNFKRDANKIFPEGVLSLHLTFFPGEGPPPIQDVDCGEGRRFSSRPSTINAGTQTSTHSLSNQGCSCSSDSCGMDKLSKNFKDMMLNEEDCDVILNVKRRTFRAHKPILKARSPVFATMFRQEMREKKSGVVDIDDCDPDAFHDFLLYLYTAKLEQLDGNSAVHLHYIGQKYDVKELTATCVRFMIENLTVDHFCEIVAVGLQHCELDLLEAADNFFATNLNKILTTEKWRVFFVENSTEAHELLSKALGKNKLLPIP